MRFTKPLSRHCIWLVIFTFFLMYSQPTQAAAKETYKKILEKYKVDEKPANHKKMAAWCKKKKHEKLNHHLHLYNVYRFNKAVAKLPDEPKLTQIKSLFKLALKYKLSESYKKYHDIWGDRSVKESFEKLKVVDEKTLMKLLQWILKEDLIHTSESVKVANKYFELKPDDEKIRRSFAYLKLDGKWLSYHSLEDKWFKSVTLRIKLHKELEINKKFKKKVKKVYPKNPLAKFILDEGVRYKLIDKSNGTSRYYLWASKTKDAQKPRPLIIHFHGGGGPKSTAEDSYNSAKNTIQTWSRNPLMSDYVFFSPTVKLHIGNSWGARQNIVDWLDALDEIFELFNIDKKRIYMFGYSMGSNGICQYGFSVPEVAAVFGLGGASIWPFDCAKDLLGKKFMVYHGMKEPEWRTKSKVTYVRKIRENNGVVDVKDFPQYAHSIPSAEYIPDVIREFNKTTSEVEPDFKIIRKVLIARFKNRKSNGDVLPDTK